MTENSKCYVFLGPPGCGKGTQSKYLKQSRDVEHLSTGDLLRDELSQNTILGEKIRASINKGDLVDDETVLSLLRSHIEKYISAGKSFVLDGFPRNLKQAILLDEVLQRLDLPINKVVYFNILDELILERIEGRRVHLPSGRTYHVKLNPPRVDDLDDITGEKLTVRSDDTADILSRRLKVYHEEMKAVLAYYHKNGLIVEIDASCPLGIVTAQLASIFDSE